MRKYNRYQLKKEKRERALRLFMKITNEVSRVMIYFLAVLGAMAILSTPEFAHASVESSLFTLRAKLTGVILPVVAVCGILFAAFSFFSGHEKAKQHIIYAIFGCAIGFGAQAIVDFMAQNVN